MKTNLKRAGSFFILISLMLTLTFSGCNKAEVPIVNPEETGEYPVTVNNLEIAVKPQKVLVLSPGLADIVIAIGAEQSLAAASADCEQEDLEVLPKVSVSDTQAVVDTGADLILTEPLDESTRAALENAAIPMLEVELAASREEFEHMYAQVATALLGDGYGYDLGLDTARNIFITMDTIQRETREYLNNTIVTACYLYDTDGKAMTGDRLGNLILEYAGLTNIFTSQSGDHYSRDTLKLSNPNIIFCDIGVKDEILSDESFSEIQAVVDGKVYEVAHSRMEMYGKVYLVTSELAGLAFPELMQEVAPEPEDPTSKINSEVEAEFNKSMPSSGEGSVPPESSAATSASSTASESPKPAATASPAKSESVEDDGEYTVLEFGDDGDEVYALQERLEELGYLDVEYDGQYGDYTVTALEAFQKANGLNDTGIASVETQKKLFSDKAVPKS